ncbi:MAG: hypothetical protein E7480_07255 [Ruminococcaceae bacterium]|nr:hypothetical protein [Oscillospiraceae bacterium]
MKNEKWIWIEEKYNNRPELVIFRKKVFVDKVPKSLEINIAADSRYLLRINSAIVSRGPARSTAEKRYVDSVDIAPYLTQGDNVITAEVIHYVGNKHIANLFLAGPTSVPATEQGGLLIYGDERFCTNSEYKCIRAQGYLFEEDKIAGYLGFFEKVIASEMPRNFTQLDFDDSAWINAVEIFGNEPFIYYGLSNVWQLEKRSIPMPYEEEYTDVKINRFSGASFATEDKKSFDFKAGQDGFIELDMQTYFTGYPVILVSGSAETHITYSESYMFDEGYKKELKLVRDDFSREGAYLTGSVDTYLSSKETSVYTPFNYRAFRFIKLEVKNAKENVHIELLPFIRTGYPLKVTTEFSCNDSIYEKMWQVSILTLKSCMYESYMDCPHYEQMQYIMDTSLEALYTAMLSRDGRLAKKALCDFADSQTQSGLLTCNAPSNIRQIIPGFSLFFIYMLEDYYMYNSDGEQAVREHLPVVEKILNFFLKHISDNGLLDNTGFWQFVDWADEWDAGIPVKEDKENVIYSMMLVSALRSASRLNRYVGRACTASEYEEKAVKLSESINSLCIDDNDGMYYHEIGESKKSQQAQVWAVLSGLCTGEKATEIMKKAVTDSEMIKCSFCMHYFLFRALEKTGLYSYAQKLWTPWQEMLKVNIFTWAEDSVNWRSDCHAWSASPLYEFVACGLGVTPLKRAFEEIKIEPKMLWLESCSGQFDTGKGIVNISWNKTDDKFKIEVSSKNKIKALIVLPNGKQHSIEIDGKVNFEC